MAAPTVDPQPGAQPARRVVLVVEDEVIIRALTAETLRQAGFEVVEAADAREALAVLSAAGAPDAMITDVKMPGDVDGLGLAAQARGAWPGLKVVVTSGHASDDAAAPYADAFLQKPYALDHLVGRVRALLEPE